MAARGRNIDHGAPDNRGHFAIMQPSLPGDALDCSSRADGLGLEWELTNPATKEPVVATLIHRRSCYTDSPLFETFTRLIYGLSGEEILAKLRRRYPQMCEGMVEVWVFQKCE